LNKYEEALKVYEESTGLLKSEFNYEHEGLEEAHQTVQSLVMRATPKKFKAYQQPRIQNFTEYTVTRYKCPNCYAIKPDDEVWTFCPRCGQRLEMDLGEKP
jgi:Zn finger protein HypA/HybF involved in hydrogenase expression